MNNLLVMKFGGTSMGSAERIKVAAGICTEQKRGRPVVAVVSAMSGVTDLLLNTLRHAEGGDETGIAANLERHGPPALAALPVLLQDERLSTAAVTRGMIEDYDMSRAKRAERVDAAAAAWILESALARLR